MKRIPQVLLVSLLLAAPFGALAQTPFDVDGLFQRADTDRNGRLSTAEIRVDASADFRRYDLDRNGELSREEVRKQQLAHGDGALAPDLLASTVAATFAYYDMDGDGRVSQEDYVQRALEQIRQADANRDGEITVEELRRFHGQIAR